MQYNILRQRMLRRGCALGVPALIGVLEADANAAIPQTLIPSLLAVPKLAAAGAASGTVSTNIIYLMEGALKTMAITKIKTVGVGILIALLIGTVGIVTVKEIQKRQNPRVNDKASIVVSNEKQKEQPQSRISVTPPFFFLFAGSVSHLRFSFYLAGSVSHLRFSFYLS